MNRFVLKDKQGRYFALNKAGDGKVYHRTYDFDKATIVDAHRAATLTSRYHYLSAFNYDIEVLAYYPHVAYHATDEIDAKKYVRKIHLGEADGQFAQAKAVKVQGLWFVYARREAVTA